MTINWNAIAAVAELLGAVAVVVSILFLARQVRESNRASRADAIRARGERMVDIWFRIAESDRLSSTAAAALFEGKAFEDLDPDQQRTQHAVVRALSLLWESEYLEYKHGAIDDDVWARRLGSVVAMLEQKPAYDAVWSDVKPILTEGFVTQVENARAEVRRTHGTVTAAVRAEPPPPA